MTCVRGGLAKAVAALLLLVPLSGNAPSEPREALLAAARQALARGDGVLGETKLQAALRQGVPRESVAADMGEAYLLRGDVDGAAAWLAPARFSPDTAAQGYRRLARLREMEGRLPEAGEALDRALAITPDDAGLWVEIGRLRYKRGDHDLAVAAAERAVAIDPTFPRALQFRGQLIRDRYGLQAAIPWFERGLTKAPEDLDLLGDYAATLGELGRAREMLIVTRRMLEIDPRNARAYYLQAVMAARAGRYALARGLLDRLRGRMAQEPAVMLLEGALHLAAGNAGTATGVFERLLARRPDLGSARLLLARALYMSGRHADVVARFAAEAGQPDASPYLLTVVARAHESLGDRQSAGVLLDRAAAPPRPSLRVIPDRTRVGSLLAQGRAAEAQALAEQALLAQPGYYDNHSLAGDVQLVRGQAAAAQQRYDQAAKLRMPDSLLLRRFAAYAAADDTGAAGAMVSAHLAQDPGNRTALRLFATLALRTGDTRRAAAVLEHLRRTGSGQDVQLLVELAFAQAESGAVRQAVANAQTAYRLQRANPLAARALAVSYRAMGSRLEQAAALEAKARSILGDGGDFGTEAGSVRTSMLSPAQFRIDES